MDKGRLEAFSDGVLAIILTIMVLELKVPHGGTLSELCPLFPTFVSYALSFVYIGIYWNNHHHMLHAAEKVNGTVLWLNLHLLFWLSLVPFCTGWMGENHFAAGPVGLYGAVLLMAGLAFTLLTRALICLHGHDSELGIALGHDFKGKVSVVIYTLAVALSFTARWLSLALYFLVAAMWFLPDPRIEKKVLEDEGAETK